MLFWGMEFRSTLLRRLRERGYIHQCTDALGLDAAAAAAEARGEGTTAYVGFDCTAPSLHIGNPLSIMMLRLLQKSGHRPIVLLGGGTTRIGDPSGKEESRKLLDEAAIEANIGRIKTCFGRFLDFGAAPGGALLANNRDWLDGLNCIDFLRDYGRHFSVNRMLGFDSVRLRLEREQPLSFLEFNYMVFQAFDFLELARREDCILQMGGSDQWGNIVNGVELARRVEGRALYGLTSPLVTTAGGRKMGKTAAGALWLDAAMTQPWEYWQHWRNAADEDAGRFLRLFTELPLDEIARLDALQGQEANEAKIVLADKATALLHGEGVLPEIHAGVQASFGGMAGEAAREAIPSVPIPWHSLRHGYGLLNALVETGLASTNSEARRSVREGAVRVNWVRIDDERHLLRVDAIDPKGKIRLSVGRKRHRLLIVEGALPAR